MRPLLILSLALFGPACADPGGDDDDSAPANFGPSVDAVAVEPGFPHTDDDVTAAVTASDPEGDALAFTYTWFVNGEDAGAPDAIALDGSAWFDRGDRLSVEVAATDVAGNRSDALRSAEVEVLNSIPGVPQLAITSGGAITAGDTDIVCSIATGATDADGDVLTYAFRWQLDFADWAGRPGTTTETGDTIPGAETATGQVWTCLVATSDGTDEAPEVSTSVTVP